MNVQNVGKINGLMPSEALKKTEDQTPGASFKDALKNVSESVEEKPQAKTPFTIQFSNHAVERMSARGIHFTPEQMTGIESAVNKASEKGAKETLILTDNAAAIVDIENKKVVTVMDKGSLRENVFTNIDSTVFV